MKLMGIDFGTKNVGIALSDESMSFAFPHTILKNDDKLIKNILIISKNENISKIILGYPEGLKGDAGEIINKINEFELVLKKETNLPIFTENEVLTSVQARRPLRGEKARAPIANKKRNQINTKNKKVDASAAALILQTFIDRTKLV